jgi:cysteinyl-tRNA synthetase
VTEAIAAGLAKFEDALADDLQLERAIAAALNLVDELNRADLSAGDATAALAALESVDSILDVLTRKRLGSIPKDQLDRWADDGFLREVANRHTEWTSRDDLARVHASLSAGDLPPADQLTAVAGDLDDTLIELFIAVRQLARKGKDFATADALRDDLKRRGIVVQDSPKTIDWAIG